MARTIGWVDTDAVKEAKVPEQVKPVPVSDNTESAEEETVKPVRKTAKKK